MKRTSVILMLASLAISCGIQTVYTQNNDTAVINRFIAGRAKSEGAEEYEDARKIVRADVNADGRADAAVLYTLEGFGGGNSYRQYLAIFLASGKTIRNAANTAVGGKLFRDVEIRSVAAGKIDLDTKSYRSNDPACCPSKKGKTSYVFTQGKLKEVK